jgi:hypothetical protein
MHNQLNVSGRHLYEHQLFPYSYTAIINVVIDKIIDKHEK